MKKIKLLILSAIISAAIVSPVAAVTVTAKGQLGVATNISQLYQTTEAGVMVRWGDLERAPVGLGAGIRNYQEVMTFNKQRATGETNDSSMPKYEQGDFWPDASVEYLYNPFFYLTFNVGGFYIGMGADPTNKLKNSAEGSSFVNPAIICGYDIPVAKTRIGNFAANVDATWFLAPISGGDNGLGSIFISIFGNILPKLNVGVTYTYDWKF